MSQDYKSFSEALEAKLDHFFAMHKGNDPESGLHERVVNEVERILLKKTLNHTSGVQVRASNILGINRNTLRKKIKELGI